MRAALYTRVSRSDLHSENQERILVQVAEKEGWDYEVFREEITTRKTRPVKAAMLQRLREREFNILAFTRLDRFARSMQELVMDVEYLVEHGIDVWIIQQGLHFSDTNMTAMARLHLQILAAFAEFEREIIRERTIEGLARVRAQGKKLGRPRKKLHP